MTSVSFALMFALLRHFKHYSKSLLSVSVGLQSAETLKLSVEYSSLKSQNR